MRPLDEFANLCGSVDTSLTGLGFFREGIAARWSSNRDGRSWTARFSRDRRTRYAGEVRTRSTLGYRLRIDLTTSVRVRFYLVLSGFASNGLVRLIYRWRRLEVLPESPAPLPEFLVVTSDREWAARLVGSPATSQALASLSEVRQGAGATASVYFEPGSLHYASPRLQPSDVTSERVTLALEELEELVRGAEGLPAPGRPATIGRLQALAKSHPVLAAITFLALFGVVSLMAVLAMMAIAWLVFG